MTLAKGEEQPFQKEGGRFSKMGLAGNTLRSWAAWILAWEDLQEKRKTAIVTRENELADWLTAALEDYGIKPGRVSGLGTALLRWRGGAA